MELDRLSIRELEVLRLIGDGSSDIEIAQKLYLSVNTVKWHNRNIYSKLGVSSRTGATAAASQKGLLEDHPAPQDDTATKFTHNLPAPITSFVGREQEIANIRKLQESARLLTITGPAGVGKTRLAIRAATELAIENTFEEGIYFVDLAPINKPARVGGAIREALGMLSAKGHRDIEVVEKYLENKKILLLIDNFEHLLEAAPLICDLLAAASKVSVLTTSREALNLYGEHVYPVSPLSLPNLSDKTLPLTLAENESVKLFIQRAQAVKPDFTLTEKNLSAIAEICTRLDGLPLAIELAAAQIKVFNIQILLKQMENRFTTLKDGPCDFPERHRTLQRAIDWSYELLDDTDRMLLNRLSVYQGGRTIEAVEEVCCHDLARDVLDGLASLFNKNLLRQEQGLDGEPRFTMLETIHEYARLRLQESGEAEEMHRRHAQYFTALAERAKYHTRGGPEQIRWLRRLDTELDNLRKMYDWSMEGGNVVLGLRLVGTMDHFWLRTGYYDESKQWITQALELIDEHPPAVKAGVYASAGMVFWYLEEFASSKHMYKEALARYQELGNRRETGWIHIFLAILSQGALEKDKEFRDNFNKGITLLRESGDTAGITAALTIFGMHAVRIGNFTDARESFEKSLAIARETGDGLRECVNLTDIGVLLLNEGDAKSAHVMYKDSLKLNLTLGYNKDWGGSIFIFLAGTALALGHPKRAVILLGAADALSSRRGGFSQPYNTTQFQTYQAGSHAQLDKETYKAAWEEGQSMSYDQAVSYALEKYSSDS